MKLFLDSANIDEVRRIAGTDAIAGVTTNPSLMAKEGKGDYREKLVEIALTLNQTTHMGPKHLSVEILTTNPSEMYAEAVDLWDALREFDRLDLHVKVPVLLDTLPVITEITRDVDVKVNATACMTADQAYMAERAGAQCVSFFYNRMKDGKLDADAEINRFYRDYHYTKNGPVEAPLIICGSIRQPADIIRCWENGADVVTVPMSIIEKFMFHEKTDEAVRKFREDIEKWLA
jgi:transaldolase